MGENGERKKLMWDIKKGLLTLSANELFHIAQSMSPVPGEEKPQLEEGDEEGCFEYIRTFINSKHLLDLEDAGMAHLLGLKDVVDTAIQSRVSGPQVHVDDVGLHSVKVCQNNVKSNAVVSSNSPAIDVSTVSTTLNTMTAEATDPTELHKILSAYEEISRKIATLTSHPTPQSPAQVEPMPQSSPRGQSESTTPATRDAVVSLRALHLHRREFKIQGGQIGDQGSDMSYSTVCRQMDEGLKEQFTDAEVVRAVLRAIKPGTFKDMLINKDDLTVEEMKRFLHTHLGEQSNTELFQELMCTKQKDRETPQQFLYRIISLKQKILLALKQTDTDARYSPSTVQDVFLHTVCQGLGHKYDDVRRELKLTLADPRVSDETILKQIQKIMNDESERQRRLGLTTRQRPTHVHNAQVEEVTAAHSSTEREESSRRKQCLEKKEDMIKNLTERVEKLTTLVELMQQQWSTPTPRPEQTRPNKRDKPFGCANCVKDNRTDCKHCFCCGSEDHRLAGCLKRPSRQGNVSRFLSGGKQ